MTTELEFITQALQAPENDLADPIVIVTTAAIGWHPNFEPTLEQWRYALKYVGKTQKALNFVIGDMLNYAEPRWGEMYDEAMKVTGWDYDRLRRCKWVAGAVDLCIRKHNLSWSQHVEVAKLHPNEQRYWLTQAEAEDWSTRQLREAIQQSQLPDDEEGESGGPPFEQEDEEKEEIASKTEQDAIEDDPQEDGGEKDNMGVHYSSEKDEWETPQDLFDAIDREFHFDLDVCASPANAKCENYFTIEDDGLNQDWAKRICWMNPPYGQQISDWTAKAYMEALRGATVACLVPARTDTNWWWDYCIQGEIRFIKGRLKFSNSENSAPFPSAVVVFYPTVRNEDAQVIWWGEYK